MEYNVLLKRVQIAGVGIRKKRVYRQVLKNTGEVRRNQGAFSATSAMLEGSNTVPGSQDWSQRMQRARVTPR